MPENKVEIILNSAEELMYKATEPNREITVDKIAKNAGIGKGSIYYYFESKDEIMDAVIERSCSAAIREFFAGIDNCVSTREKLRLLFRSILREEFFDSSKNILMALHVQEDIVMHYKMMSNVIKTVSPILSRLLREGCADGSVHTDSPDESAEMIVAMLTYLLNNSINGQDRESVYRKMKLYSQVLETCLKAEPGSFDFLTEPVLENG